MNDRLKFRAKDIQTGKWVYGYYAELPFGLGSTGIRGEFGDAAPYILETKTKQSSYFSNAEPHEVVVCEEYRVDEKTVGQCTGLKDKKGKLIYEGDIVKDDVDGEYGVVFFSQHFMRWQIKFIKGRKHLLDCALGVHIFDWVYPKMNLEVIGNIHDKEMIDGND